MDTQQEAPALPSKFDEIQEALKNKNRNRAARLLAEQAKDLPAESGHRLGLGQLAQQIGEAAISKFFASHAVAADQGSATMLRAATLMADAGDYVGARKLATKVVTLAKDFAPGWSLKGTFELQDGDFEEAEKSLAKAIFIQPKSAPHRMEMALLKTYKPEDPFVKDMLRAQGIMRSTSAINFSVYLFALAKILEDVGEIDQAWVAYNDACSFMAQVNKYDFDADNKSAQNILKSLSSGTFKQLKPSGDASDRTIFIFGNQRSGASLVERVLTGHTDVKGGGGLGIFALAAANLEEVSPEKLVEAQTKWDNPWRDFAVAYNHMIKSRFGADGRVVDRTLSQSRLAPLIHHILPNAPMIWVRRNIDATAISQLKACFQQGARWSFNQKTLAQHLALEEKLFQAIQPAIGDKLLVVNYEDLVSNPEGEAQKILAHCGLSSYPEAGQTHKVASPLPSLSVADASQPLHTNAVSPSPEEIAKIADFKATYEQLIS